MNNPMIKNILFVVVAIIALYIGVNILMFVTSLVLKLLVPALIIAAIYFGYRYFKTGKRPF